MSLTIILLAFPGSFICRENIKSSKKSKNKYLLTAKAEWRCAANIHKNHLCECVISDLENVIAAISLVSIYIVIILNSHCCHNTAPICKNYYHQPFCNPHTGCVPSALLWIMRFDLNIFEMLHYRVIKNTFASDFRFWIYNCAIENLKG